MEQWIDESKPAIVTIRKPLSEVYDFVRNFENMPQFMPDLKEVKVSSPLHSHWVFEKNGRTYEYDSEIIAEEPRKMFAWHSIDTSDFGKVGKATFAPAGDGRATVVTLKTSEDEDGGNTDGFNQDLTDDHPKSKSFVNLKRLKAYLETGRVPAIDV